MKWDNEFYGHRAVLGHYVGCTGEAPPIWGYLQHGWQSGAGFPERYRFLPGFSLFVWSSTNAVQASTRSRHVVAIGAPFLYLLRMTTSSEPVPHPHRGTIFYPFHTAPRQPVYGSHADLLADVKEREHDPVTACLYWMDYDDETLRRQYEEQGFRVICHGHRSDPQFLWRQYHELISHRRVVTNRVATALWYGAATGREVEVYGSRFGQAPGDDGSDFDRFQRSRWPELFDGPLGGDQARALAEGELGKENVRPPEELATLLGWTGARRRLGKPIKKGILLRRRLIARLRSAPSGPLPPDRPQVCG